MKRIRNVIGIVFMTAAIVFTVIQLNIPAVRAAGCPSGPSQAQLSNCGSCNLVSAVSSTCEVWENCQTRWTCTYKYKADGGVGDIRIEKKVGFGLDELAVEATRQCVFLPAVKDGVFVTERHNVVTTFYNKFSKIAKTAQD